MNFDAFTIREKMFLAQYVLHVSIAKTKNKYGLKTMKESCKMILKFV